MAKSYKSQSQHRGFTVVELLIVIVVSAILAAITIVAFNGIQARANASKDTSAALAYGKALKMLVAEKGESALPTTASCLGLSAWYPISSPRFQQNQCNTWSYDVIRGLTIAVRLMVASEQQYSLCRYSRPTSLTRPSPQTL